MGRRGAVGSRNRGRRAGGRARRGEHGQAGKARDSRELARQIRDKPGQLAIREASVESRWDDGYSTPPAGRVKACRTACTTIAGGRIPAGDPAPVPGRRRPSCYLTSTVAPAAFELGLGLLGVLLGDLLEDRLGGAVDQVLGLLEAEAGERAHLLDDLDLLVAGAGEDDVELVLLLLGGRGLGRRRRRRRAGRGHGGGRGDAEPLLELLEQLGQLEHGHAGDAVEDLFLGGHQASSALLLGGRSVGRVGGRCLPGPRRWALRPVAGAASAGVGSRGFGRAGGAREPRRGGGLSVAGGAAGPLAAARGAVVGASRWPRQRRPSSVAASGGASSVVGAGAPPCLSMRAARP